MGTTLARAVLAASALASASLALLPAAVALLIALFDAAAHGLLATSGALLGLAGAVVPGGGDGSLPPYARVAIDPASTMGAALLRGVGPCAMAVAALRPGLLAARGGRAALVAATIAALATDGCAGLLAAAPGAVAAAVLVRSCSRRGAGSDPS